MRTLKISAPNFKEVFLFSIFVSFWFAASVSFGIEEDIFSATDESYEVALVVDAKYNNRKGRIELGKAQHTWRLWISNVPGVKGQVYSPTARASLLLWPSSLEDSPVGTTINTNLLESGSVQGVPVRITLVAKNSSRAQNNFMPQATQNVGWGKLFDFIIPRAEAQSYPKPGCIDHIFTKYQMVEFEQDLFNTALAALAVVSIVYPPLALSVWAELGAGIAVNVAAEGAKIILKTEFGVSLAQNQECYYGNPIPIPKPGDPEYSNYKAAVLNQALSQAISQDGLEITSVDGEKLVVKGR